MYLVVEKVNHFKDSQSLLMCDGGGDVNGRSGMTCRRLVMDHCKLAVRLLWIVLSLQQSGGGLW